MPENKTRKVGKGKFYEIHDNGGRPFFVEVSGKKLSVFRNMDTYKLVDGKFTTLLAPRKHLFDLVGEKVFLGKKSPKGGYDGLKPSEADGNSILVKKGSTYTYIGSEIYEFSPMEGDTIVSYYSNIGHSDVPYPYAIGKTHVYLLLEKVAVDVSFFKNFDKVYEDYYHVNHQLDMCLRGYGDKSLCKERASAKEQQKDLKSKTRKLKTKLLQKRV